MPTVADFSLPALDGTPINLAGQLGQPMLIVNTASLCGFTPQYAGLQEIWDRYADRGLFVLAVPSDDFGGQEPGDAASISVCTGRFGVGFPIAAKAHVRGPLAIPLFRWLAAEAGWMGRPRWNFYKYLIGPDGTVLQWFGSTTKPGAARIRAAIERVLPAA